MGGINYWIVILTLSYNVDGLEYSKKVETDIKLQKTRCSI